MNPSIEELGQGERYASIEVWNHDEIAKAIQPHLSRYSWITLPYFTVSILLLFVLVWRWIALELDFWDGLAQAGWGVILGYLLIVPHEHIHGWAYRALGFKNIHIRYNWRQLTAVCLAEREVLDGKQLALVGIAPFAVLNSILLLLALLLPDTLIFWGALNFHVAACGGDIAILNFLDANRTTGVFTYDDVIEKKSYFYRPLA